MNDILNHNNEPYNENVLTKSKIKTRWSKPITLQMQAHTPMKMQVGKEELLAFSYLFVPLLFLGMKGRKRNKKIGNRLMMR